MEMNVIQAEVECMVSNLVMQFTVTITGPVCLPPRTYTLSQQDLVMRTDSNHAVKRVIFEFLWDCIIKDYNHEVDASPIMDMFADPDKYKNLYQVEITGWPANK